MFAMHLWEKREVPRPPEYTIEYSLKELKQNNLGKCVRPLLDGISRGHTALIDQRVSASLRREVGILTALLYRNGRHRTEKFYRVLKKVEKNCARWQKLDVVEELDRLCQLMPRMILERKILALDYGGQVAKIYDDILPKVILLKGSNAPPLLDTATLPSSLSSLLQQYCASFDVNRNPLPVNKPSSDISFLNLLNISKEEDSTKASEFDDFIDSPVTNNLVNEELCNPKNEISDSLDMPVSNCYLEEDIGECVPKTKPPKKAKTLKKRKLSLETNGNTETNDGCSSKKKKVKSDAGKNLLLNSKKKKTKKNVLKSGIGKIKQNKVKKSLNEPDEEHCSAAFIKHFKAVKKQTKNINSIDSLKRFLEGEKKNRSEKVNGRVSKLLKKEDWTEFAKFLRIRLKNIEGLSKMDSGESEALQQLLGKTRVRVKFWLLFPYLKGKKPGNWKTVLGNLSS
ncbi:uncharacterized protein LOC123513093 isoform X4 [Portunus trituberculatus]|uniref:uncharacterized protein LOC123513093 isoform X4 n=1 Tax=Portunus trituberculatus TaxID=210409 RepID=UPI001E1D1EA1|nr:uncharacterized protein LOC123513093 isoform X4 [Portunus trituberculatus]